MEVQDDATTGRLTDVARQTCPGCNGDEIHIHLPRGYRVKGMSRFDRIRPDLAVAVFYLTKGAVVVKIDKGSQQRWWRSTFKLADDYYEEAVWPEFCKLR